MSNFFRINMPYGIRKVENKWVAFNREYLPVGYSRNDGTNLTDGTVNKEASYFSSYIGLTDEFLERLAEGEKIIRDESGTIRTVYLYSEATNPLSHGEHRDAYFQRLVTLGECAVPSAKSKHHLLERGEKIIDVSNKKRDWKKDN